MIEKIKTLLAFIALFVCVFMLVGISVVSGFSGAGSGTSASPYQITNISEMYEINTFYNETKYVKLMNDIDGTGFDWHPIGKTSARDGTNVQFDGDNHIVSNIVIDNSGLSSADRSGIFEGVINPFYMHDVIFENITNIDNSHNIVIDGWSVIAGRGTHDIYSSGTYSFSGVGIINSVVDSSGGISSSSTWTPTIGAFIGQTYGDPGDVILMSNCFVVNTDLKVNLSAHDGYIGGITGTTKSGHFNYMYSAIETSSQNSGGFSGISDAMNPYYYVYDYFDNTVITGLIENTYYPQYGRNTSQMKLQSTYVGFDFSNIWAMSESGSLVEGYPVFRWATKYTTPVSPTPTPTVTITVPPTGTSTPTPTPTPTSTPTGTVVPTTAINSPIGSVKWMKSNSSVATTSAYLGEPLKIVFDTLNAGQNGNSPTMDYFLLRTYKKDVQMNVFQFYEYIGFYGMPYGGSAYLYKPWIGYWSPYNDLRIVGYNDYNYIPGEPHYPTNATSIRAELVGYNVSTSTIYILGSSTITLTKNPYLTQNFTEWIFATGGEGLAYIVAMLIIIVLASIPFLILRRIVMVVEIMMIGIGLGLSFMMGLIGIWVVFGVGIGLIAIFVLTRGGSPQ